VRPLSSTLERRLRRPDSTARVLIEADVVVRGVLVNTPDEWNDCDSTTGLEVRSDGTIRLAATQQTLISSLAQAADGTSVTETHLQRPGSDTFFGALIHIDPARDPRVQFNRVIAHVDPDPASTGRIVDEWRCQLFGLVKVVAPQTDVVEIVPISGVVAVVEADVADHEVTFTFAEPVDWSFWPAGQTDVYPQITVLVCLWGIDNDSGQATNIEWQTTNAGTYTDGSSTIRAARLNLRSDGRYTIVTGATIDAPLVSLGYYSFASDDATFTTNPLDLGGTPSANSAVRLVGRARVSPGTAVRYYVRNDGDTAWIEYTDGQTADVVGVDIVTSAGVRDWRVELDTNTTTDVTPEVLAIGMEEVSTTPLYDVADVQSCEWILDPITLKARLPECRIRGLRDGVQDFNAAIDTLLSENDSADLAFNVYIGHPDDDRSAWMLIDRFPIVDDWDAEGHSHVVIAVSPLAFLRGGPTGERRLPRYDVATGEREELIYDGTSTKNAPSEIWNDLILTQLGISPFWVGAPPEDVTLTYLDEAGASQTENLSTTTGLKKRIADSDAHEEIDAIGFVPGFATVSSQGVITAVRMRGGEGPIRAIFSADDLTWVSVTPGFRYRRPVLFTEYNFWDSPDDPDEVRSFHQNAIDNLGAGRISAPERLSETVGSWITTTAIAEAVGAREVQAFGTGLLQWSFGSIWPYPELELGDRVAVEVDRFAAKDPNVARSLRGALWAVGRVVGIHDVWGTQLSIAIENWADIISSAEVVTRVNLNAIARCSVYLTAAESIGFPVNNYDIPWDAEAEDIGGFWVVGTPTDLVIPGTGRYHMELTGVATYGGGGGWFNLRINDVTISTFDNSTLPSGGNFRLPDTRWLQTGDVVTVTMNAGISAWQVDEATFSIVKEQVGDRPIPGTAGSRRRSGRGGFSGGGGLE
jgi:hypothetical protein